MDRINAILKGSLSSICLSIGINIATIIAAVAVFDIHIDKTPVISIKPNNKGNGLFPKTFNKRVEQNSSILNLCMALASIKPPKKSIIIGLPNGKRNIL